MKINKTKESSHTTFYDIPVGDCKWTSGFWAEKFKTCVETMLPYMGELLCGDIGHALNNFKRAAGIQKGEHLGMFWHDGDFYKWMEAAIYVYAHTKDQTILDRLDTHIDIISQAQLPDGYLQTQIQLRPEVDRYENRKYHEMYNTGHLLITACAHHSITGQNNFLEIAIKHADLLYTIFYPETKRYARFGFNQTQILGLVELYRVTDDERYLQLAERFINRRGRYEVKHDASTEGYPIGDMVQERVALRDAKEAAGHAVLALYYYAGAADVYSHTGEQALIEALDRLWESVTQRKMYVTGAVGQTHYGASSNRDKIEEGFIDDYMMPNMTAYNETCANLCNAFFSQRMLNIHGEARYVDIIELVMYNSGLSGISLEGKDYFYANPLRMIRGAREYGAHENDTETPDREPYLECFCCPPNLVRTIARVSQWAYSLTANGLSVNMFGSNELTTTLRDGSEIILHQETDYPWQGKIAITIKKCRSTSIELLIRIPEWTQGATVQINGESVPEKVVSGQYTILDRVWTSGDTITLDLPMETKLIEGHPRIEEVRNQVVIKRGPIVYCIETPDLPPGSRVLDVYLIGDQQLNAVYHSDLLGGITTIQGEIGLRTTDDQHMYSPITKPLWEKHNVQFVPYYAWSNRGTAEMTVFLPVIWSTPHT